jgi:hypothetical protein
MSLREDGDTPQSFLDVRVLDGLREASPASDPSGTTSTADPSQVAATTLPAAPAAPGDGSDPEGPIPFARHKEILEAERKRAADLETRVAGVAWAEELQQSGLTPQQVKQATALLREFEGDPAGLLAKLQQQDPALSQTVRKWASALLGLSANGHGTNGQSATDDQEPQPDQWGQFPDGVKPIYSPEQRQKWIEWQQRQMDARFRPIEERFAAEDAAKAEQQTAARNAQAFSDWLRADFDALKGDEFFEAHRKEINEWLQAEYAAGHQRSIRDGYAHILRTKVIPTLRHTAGSQTVAELQKLAAASSANPNAAAPVTPAEIHSFNDPRAKAMLKG